MKVLKKRFFKENITFDQVKNKKINLFPLFSNVCNVHFA